MNAAVATCMCLSSPNLKRGAEALASYQTLTCVQCGDYCEKKECFNHHRPKVPMRA